MKHSLLNVIHKVHDDIIYRDPFHMVHLIMKFSGSGESLAKFSSISIHGKAGSKVSL